MFFPAGIESAIPVDESDRSVSSSLSPLVLVPDSMTIDEMRSFYLHKRCLEPFLPNTKSPYGIAKMYEFQKNYDLAVEWFERAIKNQDKVISSILDVAGIYSKFGDYHYGLQYMEKCRKLVPSDRSTSFQHMYQRMEWDMFRPPNRMLRVLIVDLLDETIGPLDYRLCVRIFPNPEKIRIVVACESGKRGYVEFDSHSAARKAFLAEKTTRFVQVSWPSDKRTVIATASPSSVLGKCIKSNPLPILRKVVMQYTVLDDYEPEIEPELPRELLFIDSWIHCAKFRVSTIGIQSEPTWGNDWLFFGDYAEVNGCRDLAFAIYGRIAVLSYTGPSPLNRITIEARLRLAWLVAISTRNFTLAIDMLVYEKSFLVSFLKHFDDCVVNNNLSASFDEEVGVFENSIEKNFLDVIGSYKFGGELPLHFQTKSTVAETILLAATSNGIFNIFQKKYLYQP